MTEYLDIVRNASCKCIDDIIDLCHQFVPMQYKACPWTHPDLNHGIDLLTSDDALNCYMSAYGDMHSSKCRIAMMNFPYENHQGTIEIVDWGCGQGIGSATIIDILKQRGLIQWVKRITLIEPSLQALQRAECNISILTDNSIDINSENLFLPTITDNPDNTIKSVGYRYDNVLHVFSNILDVRSIDLAALAQMVASSYGKHYILCIGPLNNLSYRIEKFCSVFGEQEYFSKINSGCFARTKRTAHQYTCMTRCFVYNGASLDLSRLSLYQETDDEALSDYNLKLQIQNGVLSPQKARVAYRLQKILSIDDIMYITPVVNEVVIDFIIVRPNKGCLIINVFEENLEFCHLSEDRKELILQSNELTRVYQSPIELINLCQTNIKDGIEELLISTIEDRRNFNLIKKVVVFTENNIATIREFFDVKGEQKYTYLYGSEFISDASISRKLYETTKCLYSNSVFDEVVVRRISKIISPAWHSYQEGRIGTEAKGAQRNLIGSSNIQQKISGVAGSGKTHVLSVRAINAMKRTGGNVLILTFNKTLPNYLRIRLSELREDFSWGKIDIYPYHEFFRTRASECRLHVDFDSYENIDFFKDAPTYKRYSAIFIDEVQDYKTIWLRIIMQYFLIEPNGEFVVFGDSKQNVYNRPIDENGEIYLGVIRGDWNHSLSKGRRFTNPRLATLANTFDKLYLPSSQRDNIETEKSKENTLNLQVVTYYDMRTLNSLDNVVDKITSIIGNDMSVANEFVVIASSTKLLRNIDYLYRIKTGEETEVTFVTTEQYNHLKELHNVTDENAATWKFERDYKALEETRKRFFTTDNRCLKFSTIQSFKGWESPSVIFLLEKLEKGEFSLNYPNLIYTAITRARESLYIINIDNYTYHDFFKTQAI